MNAQDGIERAVLEPAHEQFAERGIGGTAENKSADVGRPVRNAGEREVQARRNLAPEAEPIGIDVARPRGDRVALRSGKRRARQNEHALLIRRAALSFIHGLRIEQRISIDVAIAAAGRELVIQQDVLFLAFGLRFGRIHPPGIERRC